MFNEAQIQLQQANLNKNISREEININLKIQKNIKEFKIRLGINQGKMGIVRELIQQAGE